MERTRYLRASDPYELHADGGMLERVAALPAGDCDHCGRQCRALYRCARLGSHMNLCYICRGEPDRALYEATQ